MPASRLPFPLQNRFSHSVMSSAATWFRDEADGVILFIKAQPRASVNKIDGVQGAELRVKITAPPVDSAANEALVRFLAETLGISRGQVQLVRGASARHKAVKISGLKSSQLLERLQL